MAENIENKKNTMTPKDFIDIIINKWYILTSICVACVIFSVIVTIGFIKPKYTSTAKLYIKDKTATTISTGEISVSSYLTKDYEEIVVDRSILDDVIEELSLNITYSDLKSLIQTNNPENTRFLEITVSYSDAKTAKKIVDSICSITQTKIVEVMDIDRVIIFSEGNLPKVPSSPSLILNIERGLIVGILLSLVCVMIIYFKDDKIKSPDDVKKHLGITVLGCVPFINKNYTSKKK